MNQYQIILGHAIPVKILLPNTEKPTVLLLNFSHSAKMWEPLHLVEKGGYKKKLTTPARKFEAFSLNVCQFLNGIFSRDKMIPAELKTWSGETPAGTKTKISAVGYLGKALSSLDLSEEVYEKDLVVFEERINQLYNGLNSLTDEELRPVAQRIQDLFEDKTLTNLKFLRTTTPNNKEVVLVAVEDEALPVDIYLSFADGHLQNIRLRGHAIFNQDQKTLKGNKVTLENMRKLANLLIQQGMKIRCDIKEDGSAYRGIFSDNLPMPKLISDSKR